MIYICCWQFDAVFLLLFLLLFLFFFFLFSSTLDKILANTYTSTPHIVLTYTSVLFSMSQTQTELPYGNSNTALHPIHVRTYAHTNKSIHFIVSTQQRKQQAPAVAAAPPTVRLILCMCALFTLSTESTTLRQTISHFPRIRVVVASKLSNTPYTHTSTQIHRHTDICKRHCICVSC